MKKLISLLSILLFLVVLVPSKQAEADRGGGGSRGSGGFRGSGRSDGHGGFGRGGHHGRHRGFFPGLFIGGVLGWGLWSSYNYPPAYYYYPPPPPPDYYYPPPPDYYSSLPEGSQGPPPASQGTGGRMFIYPRQNQSEEQQDKDFDSCHGWAVKQTGFDPAKPPDGLPDAQTIQKSSDYLRAIDACLDARGYTLR